VDSHAVNTVMASTTTGSRTRCQACVTRRTYYEVDRGLIPR